jgi:thiol-disulfide isomerase/thioredoxin
MQKRTWLVLGAIVLVMVLAGAIAVASGGGGGSDGSADHGTSAGSSTVGSPVETAAVSVQGKPLPRLTGTGTGTDSAIGATIPKLTGEGFDGGPVTIAPTGKPQVVMFVAHWCPHCQAEVPRVVTLANDKAFNGIDVSTVATATNQAYPNYPPSAWLQREHWPFPVMVDSPQLTAGVAYGLPAYPYFVFVDAHGKVVGRADGEIDPGDLQKILTALAAGKTLPIAGSGASSSAS